MRFLFRKIILPLATLLSTFPLPAASQSIQELLLLQSEMEMQKIQDLGADRNKDTGVPTSDTFIIPNAEDAASDKTSIQQSTAPNFQDESVIQRYYGILTGEKLSVYGVSEFQQEQDSGLLFFNTMGKDYRLAAGDVLRVTLRGLFESDATYKIGRDGNLILPSLAPLNVSGITISEAEDRLLNILRYDDASAAVYISLETARLVTVQVSGAVENPRTLAIPAFTPLSRVLAYSGGIKETGSLRDIILRDRDGSINRIDFYDFLKSPNGANDPLVTDASRIFVGNQGNTVAATGFVARPGIYELPNETDIISVEELLELTGTRIIPPGLVVEALYFDANGLSQARELTLDEELSAGEVLNLRFLPTRLTNMIRVKGAVLEEYNVATASKVSISELLRNGATLAEDAFLDFALIIDDKFGSRAVDLTQIFDGQDESVEVGSEIQIFTAEKLRQLATSSVNLNTDKILSSLLDAEVAELYVNGSRIAYLPPSNSKSFAEIIRPYYRLTPYTALELAIVENSEGDAKAISLENTLKSNYPRPLVGGDKIYIFENSFLEMSSDRLSENFLDSGDFNKSELDVDEALTSQQDNTEENQLLRDNIVSWKSLTKLFARAGVLRVRLDGETRSLLPHSNNLQITEILETLGFDIKDTISDFAILSSTTKDSSLNSQIIDAFYDSDKTINNFNVISFFTPNYLSEIVASPSTDEFKKLEGISVSFFQDYSLKGFGTIGSLGKQNSYFGRYLSNPNLYPLFAIYEYYNIKERFWEKKALTISDVINGDFIEKSSTGSRLFVFTHEFIINSLGASTKPGVRPLSNVSEELRAAIIAEDPETFKVESENELSGDTISLERFGSSRVEGDAGNIEPHSKFIFSSARFVAGAVERPGYFPVSGTVSLSQLLAAAGGLTETADLTGVEIIKQKVENGVIVPDDTKVVDLNVSDATQIVLAGRYNLNIPALVNDVSNALVNVTGEVNRPGQYLVGRNDTLRDLLDKAGGLTNVAYPLGAVFTRDSIRETQSESNALLASQLEQAVLQLSQSQQDGAAKQIEAVLLYARQLRSQEVQGRLSVNLAIDDRNSPVFLQQGDNLFIPKRPSHVSIIGSVQKDTVARYGSQKRLSDYLAAAGGATKIADLRAVYILLPNGESAAASRDVIIPPGSVVVVPPKTDRLNALGLADIFSRILGNIATSVLAINNVK